MRGTGASASVLLGFLLVFPLGVGAASGHSAALPSAAPIRPDARATPVGPFGLNPSEGGSGREAVGPPPPTLDAGRTRAAALPWRFDVNRTIIPHNDTVLRGNVVNLPNALEPWAVAYDNVTDQYFVCGASSSNVEVVSAANLSLVASISTLTAGAGANTADPYAVVFDPSTREAFVANAALDTVSVISDRNDSLVSTIVVGQQPDALAFDNRTGEVFAANVDTQNVSVISAASLKVVATVGVSPFPSDLLYDPGSQQVFVGSDFLYNLTVFSAANDTVVRSLNLSAEVDGLALDPGTDSIFVALGSLSQIDVIAGANDSVSRTIRLPGQFPAAMAYDNRTDQLFVAEWFSGAIAVLDATTYAVNSTFTTLAYPEALSYLGAGQVLVVFPYVNTLWWISDSTDGEVQSFLTGHTVTDLAYGAASGEVYVADSYSSIVQAFATNWSRPTAIPVGSGPSLVTTDPARGEVLVEDASGNNVSIINETTDRPVGSLTVGYGPGALAYGAYDHEIYFQSYQDYQQGVLDAVNDSSLALAASITDSDSVVALAEDTGTHEMYAAQYTTSSESILPISETNDRAGGSIPVDFGSGAMAYDATGGEMFVVNSISAEVEVVSDARSAVVDRISTGASGSSLPTAIAYDPSLGAIAVTDQDANTLDIISLQSYAIVASVPVGETPDSVAFDPASGALLVGNSATGSISEVVQNLTPVPVPVVFHVSPASCPVVVLLNGTSAPLGASVSLLTKNYTVSVGACAGHSFSGWFPSGGVTVANASAATTTLTVLGPGNLTAAFAVPPPPSYRVYLNETGLPTGTSWSVVLQGITVGGAVPSLTTSEPNGTYTFAVAVVGEYFPTPSNGTLSVAGASDAKTVAFAERPFVASVRANVTGSGGGGNYCVGTSGPIASHPAWINVSLRGTASNGSAPYTFSWNFGDGSPNDSGPDVEHSYGSFGTWQVNLTVRDSNGRVAQNQTQVSYPAPPDPVPVCSALGPSGAELYAVGGAAIVAAVVGAFLLRRRPGRTASAPEDPEPPV